MNDCYFQNNPVITVPASPSLRQGSPWATSYSCDPGDRHTLRGTWGQGWRATHASRMIYMSKAASQGFSLFSLGCLVSS